MFAFTFVFARKSKVEEEEDSLIVMVVYLNSILSVHSDRSLVDSRPANGKHKSVH